MMGRFVRGGLVLVAVLCLAVLGAGTVVAEGPNTDAQAPFSMTVNTTLDGETNDTSFLISTGNQSFEYDYDVSWHPIGGDGPAGNETGLTGDAIINFGQPGRYYLNITGQFPHLRYPFDSFDGPQSDQPKIETVEQWGGINWQSFNGTFAGATNLEYGATDRPRLANVTSLRGMFHDASSFNGSIGDWNTASVTSMFGMFAGATSFNGPIDDWNTASVTNTSGMFQGASLFNQPIKSWNTTSVTDMSGMFGGAESFNQSLDGWDTSSVTDMSGMFFFAESFNGSIGDWNTSAVLTTRAMFQAAVSFDQPIGDWNTASVTDTSSMFLDAISFDQPIGDWNTTSVTDTRQMFWNAESFDQLIGAWDTSSVTDMNGMFRGASSFSGSLYSWDTSSVTDMSLMFDEASSFNGSIGDWDTASVTDMEDTFQGASSFEQDISRWCVEQIPEEPVDFDTDAGFEGQDRLQPNWGTTCLDGFAVTEFQAPAQAESGISIEVSAAITNTGDAAGTQDVAFVFDGAMVANTTVELDAGKSTTVEFTATLPEQTGSFEHGVFTDDDNRTAEIVLEEPGPPALPGSEGPPQDPDGDDRYEDVDGDNEFTIFDVQEFLTSFEEQTVQNNPVAFNFDEESPEDPTVTIFDV